MRALIGLVAALLVVGCGGGDKQPAPHQRASDAAVIRAWSDKLRSGDVDGASAYFAVPATVANGAGPVVLDDPALVREFNASLPCGANLTATKRDGVRTIATFVLTDRPGGGCGSGAGQKASTEFLIKDGRIVEWVRVEVPEDQQGVSPSV